MEDTRPMSRRENRDGTVAPVTFAAAATEITKLLSHGFEARPYLGGLVMQGARQEIFFSHPNPNSTQAKLLESLLAIVTARSSLDQLRAVEAMTGNSPKSRSVRNSLNPLSTQLAGVSLLCLLAGHPMRVEEAASIGFDILTLAAQSQLVLTFEGGEHWSFEQAVKELTAFNA